MVHGTNFGVEYAVYLNKPVDFYDDVLPLWVATRTRLTYTPLKDGISKLTIFSMHYLYDRMTTEPGKEYTREMNKYMGSDRELNTPHCIAVLISAIKPYRNLPFPYDSMTECMKLYSTFGRVTQNNDPVVIESATNIERTLTDVVLSEKEQTLVDLVVKHPNLANKIFYHGFLITEERY